jgi:hypothetical protein
LTSWFLSCSSFIVCVANIRQVLDTTSTNTTTETLQLVFSQLLYGLLCLSYFFLQLLLLVLLFRHRSLEDVLSDSTYFGSVDPQQNLVEVFQSIDAIAFCLRFGALRFRLLELEGGLDVQEIIIRVCDSGGYWQPI